MSEEHSQSYEESFSFGFEEEEVENLPVSQQNLKRVASTKHHQEEKLQKQELEAKQQNQKEQQYKQDDSDSIFNEDSFDEKDDEHQRRLDEERMTISKQQQQIHINNIKDGKQTKSKSRKSNRNASDSDENYDNERSKKKLKTGGASHTTQLDKKFSTSKQPQQGQQTKTIKNKKNCENEGLLKGINSIRIQQGENDSLSSSMQAFQGKSQQVNDRKREVQAGYENKEVLTETTRQVLETTDLRNFHNWIKSVIIKKYSDARKSFIKGKEDLAITKNQLYVLEIGCGMGGDLKKWLHADIAFYIGVDIAFNSLQEAHRRAREMLEKLRPDEAHKRFRYGFYQKDGSDPSDIFWKHIQEPEQEKDFGKRVFFDIVSCQMAMHYMFGSERTARNFFENASKKLNNFGYLLLTFSDANAIVKKMRNRSVYNEKLKKHIFENKYFSMAFDTLDFPVDKPYGLSYGFFLEDAVGKKDQQTRVITYTPEYLVELNNLEKLALEYSLDLKENLNFIDFYKTYRNSNKELFQTMRLNKFTEEHPSIDPDLWEISHCYRVAVFQKIDPSGNVDKKYAFSRSVHTKLLPPEPVPQPPVLSASHSFI